MLNILCGVILAYLIGSIPTSYLIGKIKGVDIRSKGSGNVGATNVLRVMGKLPASIVLIADILKGVIAVTLIASLCYKNGQISLTTFRAVLGISAIVGHNWSVFLKFKGGKGVATSLGVFMVLLPEPMAIAAIVWVLAVGFTKYVSLGSLLLAVTVPIAAALMGKELALTALAVTVCILVSYRHKENIKRLLLGAENKIGSKKS
jgi:glycerol-3-phosphate acyltransferase PlsY